MLEAFKRSRVGFLLGLVPPALFEVLPARTIWTEGRRLTASLRDSDARERQLAALAGFLVGRGTPARHEGDALLLELGPAAEDPAARGERILQIYFAQLAFGDSALLDLRPERFTITDRSLAWTPTALMGCWSPAFIAGIRRMYGGFYRTDNAEFDAGVAALDLTPAADLMLEHFGPDDQSAVTFDTQRFKATFHAIFERCRAAGLELSPGFVPLGAYLGALYLNLESLAVPLDVRSAFDHVWPD